MLKTLGTIVCVAWLLFGVNHADAAPAPSSQVKVWETSEALARARDFFEETGVIKPGNTVAVDDFTNDLYVKAQRENLLPTANQLGEEEERFEAMYRQKILEINFLQPAGEYLTWRQVELAQQQFRGVVLPTFADGQAILAAVQPAVATGQPTSLLVNHRTDEVPPVRPVQSESLTRPTLGEVTVLSDKEVADLRTSIQAAQAAGNGAQTTATEAKNMATANRREIVNLDTRMAVLEAVVNGVEGDVEQPGLMKTVAAQGSAINAMTGNVNTLTGTVNRLADKVNDSIEPRVEAVEKLGPRVVEVEAKVNSFDNWLKGNWGFTAFAVVAAAALFIWLLLVISPGLGALKRRLDDEDEAPEPGA